MHRLYESVCPMVEEAARAEEDPAVTFVRVRKLAEPIAGLARRESHRPTPRAASGPQHTRKTIENSGVLFSRNVNDGVVRAYRVEGSVGDGSATRSSIILESS